MINNTYPESVEKSGNFLRMTLQNISKYKLPYNPISYLVWYEYAIGRNNNLVADMELFFEKKEPMTVNIVSKLYKKHIADSQAVLAEEKTREFQNILMEMITHLKQSGSDIDVQGNTLEMCAFELNQATSLDTITGISKRIVQETKAMVDLSKNLKSQLDSTVSEIDMLSEELKEVRQAVKTDMLTRLLNRWGFDEAMTHVMENTKITHEPLSVIMLDIDHFKKVNDTYGHLIGDNVLKMLSKLIKDYIKGKDIASRFGGEEFILALPQTPLAGAYTLAEQIRTNLMKMNLKIKDTGKSLGQITISLGVALYREGESVEDMIKRADDALYQAKNTGRNKTVTEA